VDVGERGPQRVTVGESDHARLEAEVARERLDRGPGAPRQHGPPARGEGPAGNQLTGVSVRAIDQPAHWTNLGGRVQRRRPAGRAWGRGAGTFFVPGGADPL